MNDSPDTAQRPAQPVVATGPLFGAPIVCPVCGTEWPNDTEQGVSVSLYGRCIVCARDGEMHVGEICTERSRRYIAAGHPDPYSPNTKAEPRAQRE